MDYSDADLTKMALLMFACWIETEDPLMSRNDAIRQNRLNKIKELDTFQLERVARLRKLAEEA